MIGYMKPQNKGLNSEDREIYQALYCGLCRTLKYDYGLKGTLLINYEVVNVLLLLEALLIDNTIITKMSCSLSPFLWKKMIGYDEDHFKYGAAISIMIVALELNDNIIDDDRMRDRALLTLLKSAVEKVKREYPDAWISIKQSYDEYMVLEKYSKEHHDGFYNVLSSCGNITRMIGEIMGNCISSEIAEQIGKAMFYWGEWIYLLDAIDDFEEDIKNKKYNPLFLSDCPSDVQFLLDGIEKQAMDAITNLPLMRYEHIIHELFGKQFPERRRLVCQKSKY